MENLVIPAQKRATSGTKGAQDTRRGGLIPAVIYGGIEPVSISVNLIEARHAIYTPDFHRVMVDVDGDKVLCILKEIQYHPVTDAVTHIDFLRLEEGRKVKIDVPVKFTGLSAGLKAGGKLMQKLRRIKIKATPENLVDEISLDVTDLQLGQSVRIRDIKTGEGIEILNSPGIPIASVEIPRALKGPEETTTDATAAATPAAAAAPAAPGAKGAPATPEAAKKAEPAKKEPAKKEPGKKEDGKGKK